MERDDVELEVDGTVAVITINRPRSRNAISLGTMDLLDKALASAAHAGSLVITGAGDRAFVSGGDLKELAAIRDEDGALAMALRMRGVCDRLAEFPGPVIAALNGHALGGGAEVAVAADIRVAADDIKIGFTQSTLAIMPAWGGAERLATLVGRGRALMLAGAGTVLDAGQAQRIGLIDQVLPRTEFEQGWRSMARSLATAPARAIKHILADGTTPQAAARAFAGLWASDEHWEAVDRMTSRAV
ncbi:enoyl-CoA hydratase/isomerase family protein [Catenulispora rubra]|uniref:enoyl-CoA hydratase/isomerase family protein n=1 Tax=Catenulispora rubra TaxID=280293 RepID=UPI0018923953|nr:enoyl-CoA hydratase/isomerase family protein [Catenulispora rubra]